MLRARTRLVQAAALLAAAPFLSPDASALPAEGTRGEGPVSADHRAPPPGAPCTATVEGLLEEARTLAGRDEPEAAAALLVQALLMCPDHPDALADLAGLRILQGELTEGEALASRLVEVRPQAPHAWELLALARFLQDDAHGALRAWNQAGRPRVRDVAIQLLDPLGAREATVGTPPLPPGGLAPGQVLTVEGLIRGERRLAALPAADRARLGYRMVPGGEAAVEGTVVLGGGNPFTRADLVGHGLRLAVRRIHVVSADPLGRLERWDLTASMDGSLRRAAFALAHPAPGNHGAWRWGVEYHAGRYWSGEAESPVRERRAGVRWSHTDWVTSTVKGSLDGRLDLRPGRGTFAGVGTAWTFLPVTPRGALGARATGWVRVGGNDTGDPERLHGRAEVRGVFHAVRPRTRRPDQEGHRAGQGRRAVGLDLRGGAVLISGGSPPDLAPRIGSGGNTDILMRARSDLDSGGVVRPPLPGHAWVHGGVEALVPALALGPVELGVAVFADGAGVVSHGSLPSAGGRKGALHLGAGVRGRLPWMDGTLRADWAIDPSPGTSTFSVAWVRVHGLHRLSAH
ncbi:MAG: tetratricopeptide repeat protein [Gemmatimonadales bacterium]|nr:MAG: tetratricopeptide repeat protein [Gemmatimonadales bacterium]